ncbi:hypothetical protein NLJ89_g4015 [Agrocybe chaxingu]|uniref:P-loop containing nucleoside triphosphate hydrolase protein n=1 Tax=Agrocybe chaxingu TaxID=84603 RepID=A0A9W8MUY4_9AGAR|nr:hypothetical protein NLJ89_g4015 [Agrocybe chaxingu]
MIVARFSNNTLALPAFVASLSLLFLTFHALFDLWRDTEAEDADLDDVGANGRRFETSLDFLRDRIGSHGGFAIFCFVTARLIGCVILLALSASSTVSCYSLRPRPNTPSFSFAPLFSECPEAFMTLTYLYCSISALVSLFANKWGPLVARYNIVVLLSALSVYVYRDIWPLATYVQPPEDGPEGLTLWLKIVVLFTTAVIIPLFVPRRYVPVDPKVDPMPVTNGEDTCSLFSLLVFAFLDPVVSLAYRESHLRFDQLPPLMDKDYAKNMKRKSFPHLDTFSGTKRRHIFFGLMRIFWKEYFIMALTIFGQAFAVLLSPIGLNGLLTDLQSGGEGAVVRPWLWIICIFAGPFLRLICSQHYLFIASRTLVRAESALTQLVFEHSLRIRLKAESSIANESDGKDVGTVSPASSTQDTASVAESSSSARRTNGTDPQRDSELTAEGSREASGDSRTPSASSKGKTKDDGTALSKPKPRKEKRDAHNMIGKINNLVTTDLGNILEGRDFLMPILFFPLQVTLCVVLLYAFLGWSTFVGLITMVILLFVPGYVAKKVQEVQALRMKKTDARVQDVTEAVSVLRMIKLFGWEEKIARRIQAKRDEELFLEVITSMLMTLDQIIRSTSYLIPALTMLITYTTYTVIMKKELRPSTIFSSMAVFLVLRIQMMTGTTYLKKAIKAKVSLDRMNDFLKNTELLDAFSHAAPVVSTERDNNNKEIGFKNASFLWSLEGEDGSCTPNSRPFRLRIDGKLTFEPNCINLIIGPTGSGKTSLLMALLGEMHYIPLDPDSWFNLPRTGGIAYAAQEAWVQNETIRENILFGSPYDEARYRKVIHQCALEKDLELFDAGDNTEVGEKGLTLSGGQKARVSLARAIYSPAKIVLLDDILAALDVHTSAWIVDKCLQGDLLKGRTILLVTHNIALTRPISRNIVSISLDGTARSQNEGLEALIESDSALAAEVERDQEETIVAMEDIPSLSHKEAPNDTGKLIVAEEIAKGHVTWRSLKLFLSALGGAHPFVFFSVCITGFLLTEWFNTLQIWFMGYWGSQYEHHEPSEVRAFSYLSVYSAILFFSMVLWVAAYGFFAFASMRASRSIHVALVESILGSTLRWLDETPAGRIIARCTKDISAVDGSIPEAFYYLTELWMAMMTRLLVVFIFSPAFLVPGLGVALFGFYIGNVYLKAQLSVKREMSNARSPLLTHFGAAISGIVSIRAYGAQDAFKLESLKRVDYYVRIARISYNLNQWISVRIHFLGAIFTAGLATYLVYARPVGAANTGFSLNMVVEFCTLMLWWVRFLNSLEVEANSLERILAYLEIEHEHEQKPRASGNPPAAWPASGDLRVDNLSAQYSQNGPKVLHELSFHIASGERIGIVGRTGSGKSSLTLSLLRCIITEGSVYYDGLLTDDVNLDILRNNITIIPQIPELLSGTLRRNLDPFEQHDDATLNDALRAAGLFSLQEELGEPRLTLDSNIAMGGGNLSVGQRQILALARAMVRGTKLLILDEATSAIGTPSEVDYWGLKTEYLIAFLEDYKTDAVIQDTLRHQLSSDVTVITVAHRLQTIMDADKIMVLDSGRIAEFDSPRNLLQKEGGLFKTLVDGSGDKTLLYSMAERRASTSHCQ